MPRQNETVKRMVEEMGKGVSNETLPIPSPSKYQK